MREMQVIIVQFIITSNQTRGSVVKISLSSHTPVGRFRWGKEGKRQNNKKLSCR